MLGELQNPAAQNLLMPPLFPDTTYWIGLWRRPGEGQWTWTGTGTPMMQSGWAAGEPQHGNGDCVIMNKGTYPSWANRDCTENHVAL